MKQKTRLMSVVVATTMLMPNAIPVYANEEPLNPPIATEETLPTNGTNETTETVPEETLPPVVEETPIVPEEQPGLESSEQTPPQEEPVMEESVTPEEDRLLSETPKAAAVAKIGDVEYDNFDTAVKQAKDGEKIVVLTDVTTEKGLNLTKNLIIAGAEGTKPTITFKNDGFALWGKALQFDNCNIVMPGVGSTPYSEWHWMAISASINSSITLNNSTMLMDGTGTKSGTHAIYFSGNNKLNLNNSSLTIKNYSQDALEWDGGDGGYNCNFVNSTFISDNNRSAFTGTFYATFDNSNVQVINSRGNGSNGTYYNVKNNSNVLFQNNRNWGMSGYYIDITNNSTVTALDNGYSGIWVRAINVDGTSTLDVERNGNRSLGSTTNAGIFFQGNGKRTSVIERGARVTIKENAGSGIYTKQGVCNLTIDTNAEITNNGTGSVDTKNHYSAKYGGGIYNVGTVRLSSDVILYNNHAAVAGDDIYSKSKDKISINELGSSWELDGPNDLDKDDCKHLIDGWYLDNEGARWVAHSKDKKYQIEAFDASKHEGELALKAAHDIYKLKVNHLNTKGETIADSFTYPEKYEMDEAYDVSSKELKDIKVVATSEHGINRDVFYALVDSKPALKGVISPSNMKEKIFNVDLIYDVPKVYDVVINYVDLTNKEKPLGQYISKTPFLEGEEYNIEKEVKKDFAGYVNVGHDDIALKGKVKGPIEINVYYNKERTVTINYLEEGTNKELHSDNIYKNYFNEAYDVTKFDKIDIKGYTYVKTEGDSLKGTLDTDKVINVYYKKNVPSKTEKPKDPNKGNGTNTGAQTNVKLFAGMGIGAAALAGVLVLLKKRNK